MTGCLIRVIFVALPIALLVMGAYFIIQAADYWLEIASASGISTERLLIPQYPALEIKAFLPEKLSPSPDPIPVEVQIEVPPDLQDQMELDLQVYVDVCDYTKTSNPLQTLHLARNEAPKQLAEFELFTRNITAPRNCEIVFEVTAIDQSVSAGTTLTIDMPSVRSSYTIPVDARRNHWIALAQLISGLLVAAVSLMGGLLAIFQGIASITQRWT